MKGYVIICPGCSYRADLDEFMVSLVGECWCPMCGVGFIFEPDDDEDEEEFFEED